MGSIWKRSLSVATFGESHGPAVGVVVDGFPPRVRVDTEYIQKELDRRRPGTSEFVTARKETDRVEVLSGIVDGQTIGAPIAMLVRNKDTRSKDYSAISELFRPGHADYTYFKKYGLTPQPGGGRSSGRETVGRVAAGAVAKAFLEPYGITIVAYTVKIGQIRAKKIDAASAESDPLRCADLDVAKDMAELVRNAKSEGDSVGGVVEIVAKGVPAGLGAPVFDKLEALLGGAMLSIGGVKGVEFGEGFAITDLRGSQANDAMSPEGFLSNRCGGIIGGISTGEPVVMRIAVKPTSSIAIEQQTVDIHGWERTIAVHGRHDPCLCPRIGPVAEAMAAIVLADAVIEQNTMTMIGADE